MAATHGLSIKNDKLETTVRAMGRKMLGLNLHDPGPYCFHFSSGATIPNPVGPHVADRGTTPRYEG